MKIYEYDNYDDYVEAQTDANVKKIDNVWVKKSTIAQIHKIQPFAGRILCHGTRNAAEQNFFKSFYPVAEILGTEISHTATKFPMTIQHDFHEDMNNGTWDIIYSNSFDHAYDPEKALTTWKKQLTLGGSIYLEHMINDRTRRWDPLVISADELYKLIDSLGMKVSGKFETANNLPSRVYRITS